MKYSTSNLLFVQINLFKWSSVVIFAEERKKRMHNFLASLLYIVVRSHTAELNAYVWA